ncbi:MAG: hypothetical protein U5O15_01650 [Candidatus Krumholzibacteriota bacterium]|nr:hypothetical protein [Candidatus Krumholzibacteriota bacterium]
MKTGKYLLALIFISVFINSAEAELRPQGGIASYFGANNYFSVNPWGGIRVNVTSNSSLLLNYRFYSLQFDYTNKMGESYLRKAELNNFTTALYTRNWGHDFYAAASIFSGTDDYSAFSLDLGTELHPADRLAITAGIYYLNEDLVLWYPEEGSGKIDVYSVKGGFRYSLLDGLSLGPTLEFYRNSQEVTAYSVGAMVQFIPVEPVYVNFSYYYYSESAQYKFSGNFFSAGLNLYY